MSRNPATSDLQRVYLLWRDRSTPRWQSLLGDNSGDLLSEVWLRLDRAAGSYEHRSDQATLRYIETVADFVLRDIRRTQNRRAELMTTALEMGMRGLTATRDINRFVSAVEPRVDIDEVISASGLTRQQRIVIAGLRRGVDRETLAEMLEVSVETVREHERAAVARIRDAAKGVGG